MWVRKCFLSLYDKQTDRTMKTKTSETDVKITNQTELVLKQDWRTPYNYFRKGDYSRIEYWAKKLGKRSDQVITDLKSGSLDQWFEVR